MIDRERLELLQREFEDDPDLVASVIGTYLDQLTPRIEALAAAVARGDPNQIAESAHALKSSSVTLGVSAIAQPTAALEAQARSGAVDEASSLLDSIRAAVDPVRAALAEYC